MVEQNHQADYRPRCLTPRIEEKSVLVSIAAAPVCTRDGGFVFRGRI